jgi:hypothetical protein
MGDSHRKPDYYAGAILGPHLAYGVLNRTIQRDVGGHDGDVIQIEVTHVGWSMSRP